MSEHSLSLYDLETELMETFQQVTDLQAEGNEEDLAAAMKALEAYVTGSVQKRDKCGKYLQSLDLADEVIDIEIDRLQQQKKRLRKRREGFAKYMLFVMNRVGVKLLEGQLFSFKAKLNPPKVIIDDESKIPAEFFEPPKPQPPTINKTSIKEALLNFKEVPGAHLEQETRLVIDQ